LSPSDNLNTINFLDFNEIGYRTSADNNAFKKIQYFSKTNPQKLFNLVSDFNTRYSKISDIYVTDVESSNSLNYGTFRQHNYIVTKALNNNFSTKFENNNIDRFLNYNYGVDKNADNIIQDLSTVKLHTRYSNTQTSVKVNETLNLFKAGQTPLNTQFLNHPTKLLLLGSESDAKQYTNLVKYSLVNKFFKKNFLGKDYVNSFSDKTDLSTNLVLNNLTSFIQNNNLVYRFKNIRSNNLSYLSNEKNTRLIDNIFLKKLNPNFSVSENIMDSLIKNVIVTQLGNSYLNVYLHSSIS